MREEKAPGRNVRRFVFLFQILGNTTYSVLASSLPLYRFSMMNTYQTNLLEVDHEREDF